MTNYSHLSDKDLLHLLVMEREGGSIAQDLIDQFHTLSDLLVDAEEQELLSIKGVGIHRVRQIQAVSELARRLYQQPLDMPFRMKGPDDVAKFLMPQMRFLKKEELRVLLLNTKNCVVAMETVSVGTLNSSLLHPREVFRLAIRRSSASIILAHCHPSGDPQPSLEDLASTQRIFECGKLLGIELLDHIIIGSSRFVSLKEFGAFSD